MSKFIRSSAVIRMALTWGVGLAAVATSLLVGGVLLDVVPESVYGIRELVAVAVRALVVGGAAGALFAVVLARQERSTLFGALRRRRVAGWGFIGAAAVAGALALTSPVALPVLVLLPAVLAAGALGSGFAVGLLAVARRADARLRPGEAATRSALPPSI